MSQTARLILGCAVAISITTAGARAQTAGKALFESRCAVCHGGDANGGEFAPGILNRIVNRTDADVAGVIENGLPARGMPAVKMEAPERVSLVGYLRSMRLPQHGGMIPQEADVRLAGGKTLHGLAVNQSFGDMQLRTPDGRMHLLRKEAALYPEVTYREVTSQTDWPGYDGTPMGNRFSTLRQVNRSNAAKLAPKWIFSLPNTIPLEATPLVVEGIMYVSSANECYALDAGSGRQIWHYQRAHTKGMEGKANRGVAVAGDRVFLAIDNARFVALNRFTGLLLWEKEMADPKENYFATSAPLIAGNLVVSGIGGGDSGVRGFLVAYDQATGREAWRFWTVPGKGEAGAETWNGKDYAHPGGATWTTGSYDAAANLLYWQVGNPGPDHNGDDREGDNLYSDSVIALDPATGKLKWHYQFTPHDVWDWDAGEPLLLVDTVWQGAPRKLLLQANRNGFFYVMDRLTGKLLLGKPFVKKVTWASGIGANGRPVKTENQLPSVEGTKVCPALLGGTNWWSASFDGAQGLMFVQTIESCGVFFKVPEAWEAGRGFTGGNARYAPGDPPERILRAIDINTGKIAWELPQTGGGEARSGTLATAGGLVFFGEDSGAFMALDSATGKMLWHFQTSQTLRASPMTYVFDNRQMIALASGSNVMVFGLVE